MSTNTHLLIVDDEAATRSTLSEIFNSLGYAVRSAHDGLSALKEIRGQVPDVLLSDLNMPGMSGFELLSIVRRRLPDIHVVAMSGAFAGEGMQPGVAADAFYEKASKLDGLIHLVKAESDTNPEAGRKRSRQVAPIWIQGGQATSAGRASITLTCPECLRTFSEPLAGDGIVIREVDCGYCQAAFHFAIVSADDQASPSSFQRKAVVPERVPVQGYRHLPKM